MKLRIVGWDWRQSPQSRWAAWRLLKTYRSNSSSAAKPPKRFRISPPSIWPPRSALPMSCEKAAAAEGVQISIMVLDNDGNHVYMDRMDGQGYLNIVTADMKARTALMDRQPSKILMNRVIEDPTQELQLIQLGLFANSGRASHRRQQTVDRRRRRRRVRAARARVERRDLCAQGAGGSDRAFGRAAGRRPSAAPEP